MSREWAPGRLLTPEKEMYLFFKDQESSYIGIKRVSVSKILNRYEIREWPGGLAPHSKKRNILTYFILLICDKSDLCVNYGKLVDSHMLYGQDHLTLEEEMYLLFYFYFSKTKSHPTLI